MRVDMSIEWDKAPATGRIQVDGAGLVHALINVGWGEYDLAAHWFSFRSTDEMCRICFALDAIEAQRAIVRVTDTAAPFDFDLGEVLQQPDGTKRFASPGATVVAEVNEWASL